MSTEGKIYKDMFNDPPEHGEVIAYYFEPFESWHIGTYHAPEVGDKYSACVSGKSGFTTVYHEVPYWIRLPKFDLTEEE
jgi:hypothetical protein